MPVMELTSENFETTIFDHSIVLVDFWAKWCAPCAAFASVYEDLSNKHQDVLFSKVNLELESELSDAFSIQSIPHLLIFKEGIVIYSESGSLPKSTLSELIEQSKQVDVSDIRKEIDES